jgi:hypothetical protein
MFGFKKRLNVVEAFTQARNHQSNWERLPSRLRYLQRIPTGVNRDSQGAPAERV